MQLNAIIHLTKCSDKSSWWGTGKKASNHCLCYFVLQYKENGRVPRIWIKEAGIHTLCFNAKEAAIVSLKEYDLVAVGATTRSFSASRPTKDFLQNLKNIDHAGIYGFAFDTKIDSRLSCSPAKFIEKELINLGLKIISPFESAIVLGNRKHSELKELEEGKFH